MLHGHNCFPFSVFAVGYSLSSLKLFNRYDACMDVTDSDHKPVRCKFNVRISHADRSVRRKEFGEIVKSNEKIRSMLEELCYVPECTVSPNNIVLQNQETSLLLITNRSTKDKAVYKITCEGQSIVKNDGEAPDYSPRGAFGFPRWLEVLYLLLKYKCYFLIPKVGKKYLLDSNPTTCEKFL